MVQLIVGKKGKGKTKKVLEMVNNEITDAFGNIVYLDKGMDHMYELNNKVRLISVSDYGVTNADEFVGFICGIISQDHDLQYMYLDSFLQIACLKDGDVSTTISKLETISTKFHVDFVLSISVDESELPDNLRPSVIVSL